MGVDYVIKSKINPNMYDENDPNQYLKWALRDVKWIKVFNLLNFNLADNSLNYWCAEQVEDIYNMIKKVEEDPYQLYYGWKKEELEPHMIEDINEAITLKDDIKKMSEYFKYIADNKAYIHIF